MLVISWLRLETQCDVITRALGIITGAGDLLQEELDKIEEKAKGE